MKISIDCSKAVNEHAGVARYNWQLAHMLPLIGKDDQFFYYFNFLRGTSSKKQAIKDLIGDAKNVSYKIVPLPGKLKDKLYSSGFAISHMFMPKSDLVHAVDFITFDKGLKIPQIVTIHDLSLVRFPSHQGEKESHVRSDMLRSACEHATKVIAVSEFTKNDIIKYFCIKPEKIRVIYQGTSNIFKPIINKKLVNKKIQSLGLQDPYILFVGTIEPRKNIMNLMKAFELTKKIRTGDMLKLVLVGKKGWNAEEIYQYAQNSKFKDDIIFMNFVKDEDLVYLYNGASLFCYPSMFEGFGIPVLEAQKCALPVVTSKSSSLPEVGGDAALYADPDRYEDIADKIAQILEDETLRKKLSFASLAQSTKFSWEKCVKQTYDLYKEVLDEQ